MGSKIAFLMLGLLAMVLLISSEVAARDLAEASSNMKEAEVVEETNEVGDAKYDGYNGRGGHGGGYPGHGGGGGGYPGHGGGGGYPGHGGGGGYPGHGGGGGYPGHGGGYPGHGGGHGRGYCRYGCCGGAYHGSCRRCCSYAGEAVAAQTEDKTHN